MFLRVIAVATAARGLAQGRFQAPASTAVVLTWGRGWASAPARATAARTVRHFNQHHHGGSGVASSGFLARCGAAVRRFASTGGPRAPGRGAGKAPRRPAGQQARQQPGKQPGRKRRQQDKTNKKQNNTNNNEHAPPNTATAGGAGGGGATKVGGGEGGAAASTIAARVQRAAAALRSHDGAKSSTAVTLAKTGAVLLQLLVVQHVAKEYVFGFTLCVGSSMFPTFNMTGDLAMTEHLTFYTRDPRRDDIVLVRSPVEPDKMLLKRVVAVAGDTVYHRDKAAMHLGHRRDLRKLTVVPPGHIWVEGDNPRNSTDSRDFGPVPLALVYSRVMLKVWPPTEFGAIPPRREHESHLL